MMMNRFATRFLAVIAAVSMVIAMSAATSVVVNAKEASAHTISVSEEIEQESIVASLEVTEDGVVNYMGYLC